MKVFCIGAHKTGTTSLESALTTLGFSVCPTQEWWNNAEIQTAFYDARYSGVFDLIARYDAFQDSPFNHSDFYQVLDTTYADAQFILTVRDTDHWIASRRRWRAALVDHVFAVNEQLEQAAKIFLWREYGQANYLEIDEAAERRIYEERNLAVTSYFGAANRPLLTLDLERETDPWGRLCEYLRVPVPDIQFPHANRTK